MTENREYSINTVSADYAMLLNLLAPVFSLDYHIQRTLTATQKTQLLIEKSMCPELWYQ